MRRIRLVHVTGLVWALLLIVVVVYRAELAWAWEALPAGYRGDPHPAPPQWLMFTEAEALFAEGEDDDRAIALLERSLEIEPNADPLVLWGDILAERGDDDAALDRYREALRLDPSQLATYLRIADVFRKRGQPSERLAILEQGLGWFRENEPRFEPRPDPEVLRPFNEKAVDVHRELTDAIALLEAQVDLLQRGEDPYAD